MFCVGCFGGLQLNGHKPLIDITGHISRFRVRRSGDLKVSKFYLDSLQPTSKMDSQIQNEKAKTEKGKKHEIEFQ